jgi:hypothetical protein
MAVGDGLRATGTAPYSMGDRRLKSSSETEREWSSDMAAAQAGDGTAYARLLRAVVPFLRMVIRRQHMPADQVDDIVQDTPCCRSIVSGTLTILRAR